MIRSARVPRNCNLAKRARMALSEAPPANRAAFTAITMTPGQEATLS